MPAAADRPGIIHAPIHDIRLAVEQGDDSRDRGSWHFTSNHGNTGSRLDSTVLACLTLEVPCRYLPVYQRGNVERDDFRIK